VYEICILVIHSAVLVLCFVCVCFCTLLIPPVVPYIKAADGPNETKNKSGTSSSIERLLSETPKLSHQYSLDLYHKESFWAVQSTLSGFSPQDTSFLASDNYPLLSVCTIPVIATPGKLNKTHYTPGQGRRIVVYPTRIHWSTSTQRSSNLAGQNEWKLWRRWTY
jgi:hypothetical protein